MRARAHIQKWYYMCMSKQFDAFSVPMKKKQKKNDEKRDANRHISFDWVMNMTCEPSHSDTGT